MAWIVIEEIGTINVVQGYMDDNGVGICSKDALTSQIINFPPTDLQHMAHFILFLEQRHSISI
jgi:hypothetical protein